MLVKILEQSNQIVNKDLEELALHDPSFKKNRVTIGIKGFSMKVNVKQETQKMKKEMRKIGDKTGIGFAQEPNNTSMMTSKKVESLEARIEREAQEIIRMGGFGRGQDILDNLDQYNERFKESMKAKFQSNFVASGVENKARKEATVTFVKKGAESVKETI